MLFKPNFCCHCGVKIERAEWNVLTSRRFCDVCAVENKEHDLFPRAVVIAGILLGVFGLGAFLGDPRSADPTVLKASETDRERKPAVSAKQPFIKAEDRTQPAVREEPIAADSETSNRAGVSDVDRERPMVGSGPAEAAVYYCGAMTKKGKPCSRRVKTRGRCWQHTGQPSALVSQSAPDVY